MLIIEALISTLATLKSGIDYSEELSTFRTLESAVYDFVGLFRNTILTLLDPDEILELLKSRD